MARQTHVLRVGLSVALLLVTITASFTAVSLLHEPTPNPVADSRAACHPLDESTPVVHPTAAVTQTGPENNTLRVRVTFDIPADASQFTATVDSLPRNSSLTAATGLTAASNRQYTTNTPNDTVTLTYVQHMSWDGQRPAPAGDAWAFTTLPTIAYTWTVDGTQYCTSLTDVTAPVTATAPFHAVASPHAVYVGVERPTVRTQTLSGGESLRFVIPAEANLSQSAVTSIVTQLNTASARIDIGCRRNVTMFVLPDDARRGGAMFGNHSRDETLTTWVHEDSLFDHWSSTWIHEYAHTRQCYTTAETMRWFVEAHASYIDTAIPIRTSVEESPSDAYGYFNRNAHPNATLAAPSTWNGEPAPYTKGATVLFRLDHHLAQHGSSLSEVVRWMNRHDGPVTYAEFRSKVVAETAPETGDWLDAAVTESGVVALRERHLASPNATEMATTRAVDGASTR